MADTEVKLRSRGWCFTINNWLPEDHLRLRELIECQCLGYQEEAGEETGTPHLQGWIYFSNARTRKAVSGMLPRAHLEKMKGNVEQNIAYCSKSKTRVGEYFQKGTLPVGRGKRTDLIELKNEIKEGKSVKEIRAEKPDIYHQYGRTLDKLEDDILETKYRTWMTKGTWYHGPTATGKSERAFQGWTENPDKYYIWKNDHGWQDGYKGQEIVIIDDFRGKDIPYDELLKMVDKYPYWVNRRGRAPHPWLAKEVRITSSLSPHQCYCHRNSADKIEQLLRRFEIIKTGDTDTEVVRVIMEPNHLVAVPAGRSDVITMLS